jgi:hypothetical protein
MGMIARLRVVILPSIVRASMGVGKIVDNFRLIWYRIGYGEETKITMKCKGDRQAKA